MAIHVALAKEPYQNEFGDLVCEWSKKGVSKYLVNEENTGTERIIPLCVVHPNPWIALQQFGIDASAIKTKHKCPYTDYEYFSIIPTALLLNTDYDYKVRHWAPDYVMDWEFHKNMWKKEELLRLHDVERLLLGSGYTTCTLSTDGDRSLIQRRVMLDNGDALWCFFWEWYNK